MDMIEWTVRSLGGGSLGGGSQAGGVDSSMILSGPLWPKARPIVEYAFGAV